MEEGEVALTQVEAETAEDEAYEAAELAQDSAAKSAPEIEAAEGTRSVEEAEPPMMMEAVPSDTTPPGEFEALGQDVPDPEGEADQVSNLGPETPLSSETRSEDLALADDVQPETILIEKDTGLRSSAESFVRVLEVLLGLIAVGTGILAYYFWNRGRHVG
jgi:hypothetical protein